MKIDNIKIEKPFKDLFRIHDENYNDVIKDMDKNGYDPNEPLLIWEEENTLIDGHTRLAAAQELCIEEIPTLPLSFKDVSDALHYAIKRNANRRNVTKGDKFRLIRIVDNPQAHGGNNPEGIGGKSGKKGKDCKKTNLSFSNKDSKESAEDTAKLIGIGATTVKKMRTILNYGTEETIEDIENEEMSIDAAWKEAKAEKEKIEKERKAVKQFNRTTDSIEWALWTWNPVTGCEHGCEYCYAKDIAERLFPQGFKPTFHKKRLTAPQNNPIPKIDEPGEHNVFVCSMADLFGDWVPDEWITDVFNEIKNAPDWWNFILLTKNPKRYLDLEFPNNCWIGATATNRSQMKAATTTFKKLRKKVKNVLFISCEPLEEKIKTDLIDIDWLIIGGRSRSKGMPAKQPEWKWVESLILQCHSENIPYYMKPNLTITSKNFPKIT